VGGMIVFFQLLIQSRPGEAKNVKNIGWEFLNQHEHQQLS